MKNQSNLLTALLFLCFAVLACKPSQANVSQKPSAPSETATQNPVKAEEKQSGVTMENFTKLKTGMKYADVVKILGSEGEVLSESSIGGTTTIMYQWKSENSSFANMNAMFQNEKLISKSQMGLK